MSSKELEWRAGSVCRKRTGLSWYALLRLALLKKIRYKVFNDEVIRFCWQDVQRVASEAKEPSDG